MKILLSVTLLLIAFVSISQKTFDDSTKFYQEEYVARHEVVKGNDKALIHFFAPDASLKVTGNFEKTDGTPWFKMQTSGIMTPLYRVYGKAHFSIRNKSFTLNIYQSQSLMGTADYKDYLFVPFTDSTTGYTTYETGRYIDLVSSDIKNNVVVIDFNKAYNPYCAYVSGVYNCPIPPAENNLAIAIKAGEKSFSKKH